MPNSQKRKKSTILWVAGRWVGDSSFIPALEKKNFKIKTVSNGKEALKTISTSKPDVVVIYAASMRTSGTRICKSIREQENGLPILLISDPDNRVEENFEFANTVLTLPFTSRKLVNRIIPLAPFDKKQMEKYGPLRLDKNQRQLLCHDKKSTLTPRLIRLLNLLLENRGEVVERDVLFTQVWKTDYTGDTRTLDVHISWLRDAIEKDPRKPVYLKTIRGVGYILDL